MAENEADRRARVERLLEAARVVANAETQAGSALRSRLLETTGLSPAGVELGLTRCLETQPAAEHLAQLLASTPAAPRARVLLSGNVFTAALRAIAIGVAASAHVEVRASRRDPALAEALHALVPGSFELTAELSSQPGDHVWAYGSDSTLSDVRKSLPSGVWFHAHGYGIGAVVVDPPSPTELERVARAIALDTALFDQRGCLSPRVVCVIGSSEQASTLAQAVAGALAGLERELPPGRSSLEHAAEARKNRDAAAYAFELFDAGAGWVSLSSSLVVTPADRSLHVTHTDDAVRALSRFAQHVTCIGTNAGPATQEELRRAFPDARLARLGDMQRPPLDGPVDRRGGTRGQLLT